MYLHLKPKIYNIGPKNLERVVRRVSGRNSKRHSGHVGVFFNQLPIHSV